MSTEHLQQARDASAKRRSADRKDIYIGESLRKVLDGRKESLTTVVNLIAERYLGIVERHPFAAALLNRDDDVLLSVLREYRGPLTSADIASFPARVRDYCARHPDRAPDGGTTKHYPVVIAAVEGASFVQLVALIDSLEKTP